MICLLVSLALASTARNPQHVKDTLPPDPEIKVLWSPQTSRSSIQIVEDTLTEKTKTESEIFILGKNLYKNRRKPSGSTHYPVFEGHWSGFNYGFVNFHKNDYSLYAPDSDNFMELDWAHSFAMQFNVYKYSINLVPRNNFGLVVGLGLEYQRLRFENNNLSITKEQGRIVPCPLDDLPDLQRVKRSTFKNLYLTIPLLMEVQFPASYHNRLYISGGILGGLRMHSKTKVVYEETDGDKQKKKEKGNFYTVPFKADVVARIGYRNLNVWGSYTLTNFFRHNKGPELHAYTIGLGISF